MGKVSMDRPEIKALIDLKVDMLNLPHMHRKSAIVRFLLGDSEPDVEALFERLNNRVNTAIDAYTKKQNHLFNNSLGRVSPDDIKKQLMEK